MHGLQPGWAPPGAVQLCYATPSRRHSRGEALQAIRRSAADGGISDGASRAADAKEPVPADDAMDPPLQPPSLPRQRRRRSKGAQSLSSPEAEAADSASPMEQVVPDGSPPKVDGRGRTPKSPEWRAKMSAARKAMLERLGGVPEDWRRAYSEAASRRQWSLDVRYRMARSHAGRKCSSEVRENMAAAQRRRRSRERQAQAGAGSSSRVPPPGQVAAPQLSDSLAREKAVIELSRLRQVVFGWMAEFQAEHGRQPSMQETADSNPEVYRCFVRYIAIREMLRGGDAPYATGGGAPTGPQPAQGAAKLRNRASAAGEQQRRLRRGSSGETP